MSESEKDRLGERLRERGKGDEERYFSQRDRELLEKLRQGKDTEAETRARELARMRCPKCGERLAEIDISGGVRVDACPACHGLWLDHGELERAISYEKKAGWLTRYLERLKQPS
jgi:hypothetical protein